MKILDGEESSMRRPRSFACRSCKKQGHGEEECRKQKLPKQMDDAEGKDLEKNKSNSDKIFKEGRKGKQTQQIDKGKKVQQDDNAGAANEEGQRAHRRNLEKSKQPNFGQQSKGIWKQQNKEKSIGNPCANVLDSSANVEADSSANIEAEISALSAGNQQTSMQVEALHPIDLERGDRSGKDDAPRINLVVDLNAGFPNEVVENAQVQPDSVLPNAGKSVPEEDSVPDPKLDSEKLHRVLNEQCQISSASTFFIDHYYVRRAGQELSMDDERGLQISKEPPDKGYHSDDGFSGSIKSLEAYSQDSEAMEIVVPGARSQGETDIANCVVDFFSSLYSTERHSLGKGLFSVMPKLVSAEDNFMLTAPVALEELKDILFSMFDCRRY
ncbi:unnamed protein product [Ilex paraguariensis]|uniref:Uncharacterized protein n=1 Tax=Ilex paraguariensis TaxID=185542 RepID=A0ABC8UTH7_9AQUA